jgi:hypothetical protein
LQPHAAAARHFRHLIEREYQHLAVFADHGNGVAGNLGQGSRFVRRGDIQHLLALAGVGDAIVLIDDKALPIMAGDKELAASGIDEQRHDVGVALHVDEHADRIAMATSARQLLRIERIETPVSGEQHQLRGAFGEERVAEAVVRLKRQV